MSKGMQKIKSRASFRCVVVLKIATNSLQLFPSSSEVYVPPFASGRLVVALTNRKW